MSFHIIKNNLLKNFLSGKRIVTSGDITLLVKQQTNNLLFVKILPTNLTKRAIIFENEFHYANLFQNFTDIKPVGFHSLGGNGDTHGVRLCGLHDVWKKIFGLTHLYKSGLQTPLIPFDPKPTSRFSPGGLYASTNPNNYLGFGSKIGLVSLPIDSGSKIVVFNDQSDITVRTNKMHFEYIFEPSSLADIKDLEHLGINVSSYLKWNIDELNIKQLEEIIMDCNLEISIRINAMQNLLTKDREYAINFLPNIIKQLEQSPQSIRVGHRSNSELKSFISQLKN
jgi:hypothetical protein